MLRLLVKLSCSSSYLSFLLVPNMHPDHVVSALGGANVVRKTEHVAGHLLPVLRLEVRPELVLLKSLLQSGRHVPLLGLTLLEADFSELGLDCSLRHDDPQAAVKKVKFINDKLLR